MTHAGKTLCSKLKQFPGNICSFMFIDYLYSYRVFIMSYPYNAPVDFRSN